MAWDRLDLAVERPHRRGTTKLNDTYFNQAQYNTPAWRAFVACPEWPRQVDHQDEAFGPPNLGTCMDYTNDPDGGGACSPSNEHPNAHDYAMLNTIYNHDDGFDVDGFDQLRHPCGWTRAASRSPIRRSARRQPGRMGPGPSRWAGRPDVFGNWLGQEGDYSCLLGDRRRPEGIGTANGRSRFEEMAAYN